MNDITERIAKANARLEEEIRNGSAMDVEYWRGYRDALVRVKEAQDE